jgi:hypothetical protein
MAGAIIQARGDWTRERVRTRWVPSGLKPPPAVAELIERTWSEELRVPGVRLFDGPLCRLEAWRATGDALELDLSRTSYKPFLGTNGRHAELSRTHGESAMANAVGTSAAVVTSDGYLLFGERGPHVALYPNRVHPIGGCLEPAEHVDVIADMARELREELVVTDAEILDIRCVALGRDSALLQPELTFVARIAVARQELERRIDREEHRGSWCIPAEAGAIDHALCDGRPQTPLTRLTLLAYGAWAFGEEWFSARSG